jgi:hypothetical protein
MEFFNTFETFVEMILNSERVFRLTQNVKQIIIREEEEPRESKAFGMKIIIEALLNSFYHFIALL